jgi:nucleoside-diphosphate-sugar epimerase
MALRVAVIGATDNVGSRLLDRLQVDERVTSIVAIARRRPEGHQWTTKGEWVEADIASDDLRPHLEGADAVVHLAWLFQPTHRPMVTWRSNAAGSARVFAAAADARVPVVVYASSVGAYSPAPGRSVPESWPTHSMPTAAYGREKAYVERLLDAFEGHNPDVRVVRMRPGFIFQRQAATQQRRLFAGPWLPHRLVVPWRLPVLPVPPGLHFQAVHADDVADAYQLAITTDARGPFNLAAEPVITADLLADLLGTRPLEVPRPVMRAGVALAWRAHLVPADPALLDLVLGVPLLDTTRARDELGWVPRRSATDAVRELLDGIAEGGGSSTAPLAPDSAASRLRELAGGVGERP